MDKQKLLIGGVVLAVVLSLMAVVIGGPIGKNGQNGQSFGSVTGPDSGFPCETHNGVSYCWAYSPLQQATTTVCSLKSPLATSTLTFSTIHMNVATTGGATTLTFAKAVAGASASTTIIFGSPTAVGSGAEVNAMSSSTIFSPGQVFNITQSGGSLGSTFSETGLCQAEWIVYTRN